MGKGLQEATMSLHPGSTVERAPDELSPSALKHMWSPTDAAEFMVRVGPNYRKTGKKEASQPAFYEIAAFDFFKTDSVLQHAAAYMSMSDFPKESGHPDVPPVVIVNCQLPDGEPSMFSSPEDGPGRSAVFFFVIKPETQALLRSPPESQPPGLKLLVEYFRRASSDADFRGRFKVIAMVKNMEDLDLPGFIQSYNGKPVLITKSGSIMQGAGYMEMDIRVHKFSFLARKGLAYLSTKFAQMIFDVGLVVEGRSDEELPEQLLGASRFYRLDYHGAVPWTPPPPTSSSSSSDSGIIGGK